MRQDLPSPPCPPAPARERPGRAENYRLEASAGHLLRCAHQRHAALFQGEIGGAALTSPQFAALVQLASLGTATQNHLGRLTAIDPATIQGIVQRLISRGLVQAARNPLDRRTLVLSVTDAGQAVLMEAKQAGQRTNEALLSPLAPEERQQFLALLRRLTA